MGGTSSTEADVPPPDVVYVVRPGDDNEELRFSLRSLENIPHGRVWVAGHRPPWVTNVGTIPVPTKASKYESSTANLRAAAEHPDVSERFIYCNDDFFVLEPLAEIPILHRGPVAEVLADYRSRYPSGDYVDGMAATARLLDEQFEIADPLSYELHVPMVMDRKGLLVALDAAATWGSPRALHKRTLYGNLLRVGGSQVEDCKVHDYRSPWPSGSFASTCDTSFAGVHGRTIRRLFPAPGPYERPGSAPWEDLNMGITLRHRNGALITVEDEKAERLLATHDFTVMSQPATEPATSYDSLTVADLKDEIGRRNKDRDDPIPTTGKKADLVAALEVDDK